MTLNNILRYYILIVGLGIGILGQAQDVLAQSGRRTNELTPYEIGYTATFLMGNNAAKGLIVVPDENHVGNVTGSNIVGGQSTISARMNFEVGSSRKLIIPLGVDVMFFRGLQRLETSTDLGRASVDINITSIVAGLQYRFVDLPLSDAFLYGGVEARGSFCGGPHFVYAVEDKITHQPLPEYSLDSTLKESVFRFGGAARVGVQGILSDPLRINISYAYGAINLIGRDLRATAKDRRGELLTPSTLNETSESVVFFSQFSLMLQYRF
ncbi:MAG: hypothetical protein U0Y96_03225 [Candidatus Kapaibacterium sp.]|nr:hypothetical protein [Bacteroidota bacterium]